DVFHVEGEYLLFIVQIRKVKRIDDHLVPSGRNAVAVSLCRKFAEFEDGKPFLPWAFGFAYLEVLKQRERNQRNHRLLSVELVERLAKERESLEPALQARLTALDQCLRALPARDAALIRTPYRSKVKIDE